MKIAIPLYDNRIAPRFHYTDRMLVAQISESEVSVSEISIDKESNTLQKAQFINNMGINVLICSGIDRFTLLQLEYLGITVYHGFHGNAKEILREFSDNGFKLLITGGSPCSPERIFHSSRKRRKRNAHSKRRK